MSSSPHASPQRSSSRRRGKRPADDDHQQDDASPTRMQPVRKSPRASQPSVSEVIASGSISPVIVSTTTTSAADTDIEAHPTPGIASASPETATSTSLLPVPAKFYNKSSMAVRRGRSAGRAEVTKNNPDQILGLEQQLHDKDKDHSLEEQQQQEQQQQVDQINTSIEDDVTDVDLMSEDSLFDEDDLDEEDDELDEEEEELTEQEGENNREQELSNLTTPRPNQDKIMQRLMNDSISFSELTELMGEGETEICPAASVVDAPTAAEIAQQQQQEEDERAEEKRKRAVADSFEEELSQQQRQQLRRRIGGRAGRGRGPRLHPSLSALMGQANLCVGNSDPNEAIKMCLEVIRQFPNSYMPYETLAMIFEERDKKEKALQFNLIAAFLSPSPGKWIDLAEHYKKMDELEQAMYCYSRAIKQSPSTLAYHWSRVELLERMDNKGRALKCYTYMLKFLKPKQAEEGLRLAKEIAKIHFSLQNYVSARQAMETAFLRYPEHVSHEDINLLLDVLVTLNDYVNSLVVLQTYAKVKLLCQDMSEETFEQLPVGQQLEQATRCYVPPELPIDLRSKLTLCLIMTKTFTLAQPLIDALLSESTEEFGDLFLDTAESLLSVTEGARALPLLEKLLACSRHSLDPTVWRLYAQALVDGGGDTQQAVQAYYKVVELAPDNASARLKLSSILQQQGNHDAALLALTQQEQPYDCQVLLVRCKLLHERGDHQQFLNAVALLLGRHFINIRSRDEAEVLINNKKASNKLEALKELRKSKGEPVEDAEPSYTTSDVPTSEQWNMFVRACKLLHKNNRFAELERLTYSALGSRELMKDYMREVEFFCLQASMANNNSYFAFNLVRDVVVRYPRNNRVWNLLNQVIIKADDIRHNRFLLRRQQKHPEILALSMLNGHNSLVAGTYKYSLAEYMKVFKGRQNDPLASLMLGLTYTHMACQKFSANKNTMVTQAWVFLNSYRELRGDCQESLYNIGRAMHQLNILHQAIHYYKLALDCPKPVAGPGQPDFDLTREIALNLSLVYRKGSINMSRYYVRQYITV